MASFSEVNSFVGKFVNLWKAGRDASLQLETHAGQACVVLRVGLGEHPHQQPHKKVSPARERRRKRRAAAQNASAENAGENGSIQDAEEASKEEIVTEKEAVEEAEHEKTATCTTDEKSAATASFEVIDEVCNDEVYDSNDTLVEEILVTPECQAGWKDKTTM